MKKKMYHIPKNDWVADLETMTCRNIISNIVVIFERESNIFLPRIKDIPVDVFDKWVYMNNEEDEKEKIISEAEDVFMKAFIESDIE